MLLALVFAAAFHVQMDSNAASSFPLMSRFGAVTVDLYPRGFRVTTVWLRAFAINGDGNQITIENPVSRTYTKRPMSAIGDIVRIVGGKPLREGAPRSVEIITGNVGRLPARRYRLIYGSNDFIDIWTTASLGSNPAFRSFAEEIVKAVAPDAVPVLRKIPDTPVYVEVNVGDYRKLAMLRPRSVVFSSAGEAKALRVSSWMFPAPFDTIFK